jgi:RNA polymerase primary sigma factor
VQQLAREPEAEEIAAELKMTTAEVREIRRMAQPPVSLEKPIGEQEEAKLTDFVEDELAESPFGLLPDFRVLASVPRRAAM